MINYFNMKFQQKMNKSEKQSETVNNSLVQCKL